MRHLLFITVGRFDGDLSKTLIPTKICFEATMESVKKQLKDYPDIIPIFLPIEIDKIQVESLYD